MKRSIALVVALGLLVGACGHPKVINDTYYPTYGLFNQASSSSSKVCYELSVGNVIWSIILVETVIFPVYFIGWSIMNPVGLKNANGDCFQG